MHSSARSKIILQVLWLYILLSRRDFVAKKNIMTTYQWSFYFLACVEHCGTETETTVLDRRFGRDPPVAIVSLKAVTFVGIRFPQRSCFLPPSPTSVTSNDVSPTFAEKQVSKCGWKRVQRSDWPNLSWSCRCAAKRRFQVFQLRLTHQQIECFALQCSANAANVSERKSFLWLCQFQNSQKRCCPCANNTGTKKRRHIQKGFNSSGEGLITKQKVTNLLREQINVSASHIRSSVIHDQWKLYCCTFVCLCAL